MQHKIAAMYKHANVADETNRLGLAKGMGLVFNMCTCLFNRISLPVTQILNTLPNTLFHYQFMYHILSRLVTP